MALELHFEGWIAFGEVGEAEEGGEFPVQGKES